MPISYEAKSPGIVAALHVACPHHRDQPPLASWLLMSDGHVLVDAPGGNLLEEYIGYQPTADERDHAARDIPGLVTWAVAAPPGGDVAHRRLTLRCPSLLPDGQPCRFDPQIRDVNERKIHDFLRGLGALDKTEDTIPHPGEALPW